MILKSQTSYSTLNRLSSTTPLADLRHHRYGDRVVRTAAPRRPAGAEVAHEEVSTALHFIRKGV